MLRMSNLSKVLWGRDRRIFKREWSIKSIYFSTCWGNWVYVEWLGQGILKGEVSL